MRVRRSHVRRPGQFETALGVISDGAVTLNPPRERRFELRPEDRVIVLAQQVYR